MDSTETGSEKVRSAQEREGAGKMNRMSLDIIFCKKKEKARIEICIIKEGTRPVVNCAGVCSPQGKTV